MTDTVLGDWQKQGHALDVDGHSIFFRDDGQGDVLLCLHGYPYASWHWRKLWPVLAKQFRVIAPDMLGCGYSDKPRGFSYNIRAQTDIVLSLLQQLGVSAVHILAHDYGVSVAQEMLARSQAGQPGPVVHSICFLNGGLLPEKFKERMEHRLIRQRGMQVALLFDQKSFERSMGALYGPDTRPSNHELALDWELASCNGGLFVADKIFHFLEERIEHRERWVGALQNADIPLRLVNGAADPIAGEAMAEWYQSIVPRADVVMLPNIGHFPHLECPQEVLDAYQAFRADRRAG